MTAGPQADKIAGLQDVCTVAEEKYLFLLQKQHCSNMYIKFIFTFLNLVNFIFAIKM